MTEQPANATNAVRAAFLRSQQGTLFLIGCCMLLAWVATAAALWYFGREEWDDILSVGFAHLLAGRAISIAHGTDMELPPWSLVAIATYADMTGMFILYPLFVYTYENFFEGRFFQKRMKPMLDSARKGMDSFGRYKILGVFSFVWLPLWMTGIIAGAVLGYLLGLRTWVTMLTVSLGALAAVWSWVYAYDKLFSWLSGGHQSISLVLTPMLICILVVYRVIRKRRSCKS